MITLIVDGREIQVTKGTGLLKACLENQIYVPNLCYLEDLDAPPASCRLCFVEIDGHETPVTSCNTEARHGMVVRTDTTAVRRLQRTAFELLMSVHDVDCGHCRANKRCELQKIGRFLKVSLKPKRLDHALKEPDVYEDHPLLSCDPNRCILCGRCIHVCRSLNGRPFMALARRGFSTLVSFYGAGSPADLPCRECLACARICPVGAIGLKDAPVGEERPD